MKRKACVLLGLAVPALAACGARAAGPFTPHHGVEGEGRLGSWVHSGLYRRDYILVAPPDLDGSRLHPLLVMMHGAGGTAPGLHRWIRADSQTIAAGFVTVYPDGLDMSWDVGCGPCTSAGQQGVDDVQFINTLVRQLADSLPIDTARVFLAGHSLGAQFVHYFACESELPPAGIAAVSGLWLRRTAVRCRTRRDLPVLMIHGDADPVLPWEGPRENISALSMPEALERWRELLDCRGRPEIDDGSDAAGDGTSVQSTRVEGCRGGTVVELHRIRGGGHGWPGPVAPAPHLGPHSANLDAVAEILRFFAPYARG